jgi:hypothetical protein
MLYLIIYVLTFLIPTAMKRHFLFAGFLLLGLNLPAQWTMVNPTGMSDSSIFDLKLVCDTAGNPVVVFRDMTLKNVQCLRYTGEEWISLDTSFFRLDHARDPLDLKTDSKGNIYMLCYNDSDILTYCLKYDGSKWSRLCREPISDFYAPNAFITLDTADSVYVTFIDSQSRIKIIRERENTWQDVTTAGLPQQAYGVALGMDLNNKAYLAYEDWENLGCLTLDTDHWVSVGNVIPASARDIFLNIASNGDLYMLTTATPISCWKLNQNNQRWEKTSTDGLENIPQGIGNVVSEGLKVYVSISEYTANGKARCFMYNGEKWFQLGRDGISDGLGTYISIAVNRFGTLYALYEDAASKAIVKKYTVESGTNVIREDPLRLYPNPAHHSINIDLPGQSFILSIYDAAGQLVFSQREFNDRAWIDLAGYHPGIYQAVIRSTTTNCNRKFIVY